MTLWLVELRGVTCSGRNPVLMLSSEQRRRREYLKVVGGKSPAKFFGRGSRHLCSRSLFHSCFLRSVQVSNNLQFYRFLIFLPTPQLACIQ